MHSASGSHIPILTMITFPPQLHFSAIKKFLIDIGNAQWVDGSGVDEYQEAFELYEHLHKPSKFKAVKPD